MSGKKIIKPKYGRKKFIIKLPLMLFFFVSILVFAVSYHGCSEDPVTSNPTPTPTPSVIGTLTITPDMLLVNVSDTLVIRMSAKTGIFFTDSLVKAVKIDNNNNIIAQIGNLYDNGNLNNGDEIARDNVYSGKFILNETAEGTIKIAANGTVYSNGSTVSLLTTPVNITVYGSLNSGQVGTVMSTQNNAATQLQTFLAGNPNNITAASNQLKTWLETQPGVASV